MRLLFGTSDMPPFSRFGPRTWTSDTLQFLQEFEQYIAAPFSLADLTASVDYQQLSSHFAYTSVESTPVSRDSAPNV